MPDLITIPTTEDVTRRTFITGALASAFLLACGDGDEEGSSSGSGGGFPRTVQHVLGSTEIPTRPQRVVAVSEGEALDHVLALGLMPVLYGQTPGYDGLGILPPWAKAALTKEVESYQMPRGEPDLERIAAAKPDLIVGAWLEKEQYDLMSRIAPTVVIKDSDSVDWTAMQTTVGEAMAMEDEARKALEETEKAIAAAREKVKPFAGRSVTIGYLFFDELYMHSPNTPIARLVERLGLSVKGAPGAPADELTTFSIEQMNRYADADLLLSPWFFPDDQEKTERSPLFRALPAVQEGRYVPLSLDVAQAGYIESTLSVRWVVPQLADAIVQAAEGRGKKL
jgi:iron complex transport system substrate-binding protein